MEAVQDLRRDEEAYPRDPHLVRIAWHWPKMNPLMQEAWLAQNDEPAVEEAIRLYPGVTLAQVEEARTLLGVRAPSLHDFLLRFGLSFIYFVTLLSFSLAGMAALPLALILRGGLWFRITGIDVRRTDGAPAGRGRCLVRALVVWLPVLGWWIVRGSPSSGGAQVLAWLVSILIMAVGAVDALLHPESGLQDRIAGTRLVPR
jgi:hypothetical protein